MFERCPVVQSNFLHFIFFGAEDKDAEDFDKPNIATQAELGSEFNHFDVYND